MTPRAPDTKLWRAARMLAFAAPLGIVLASSDAQAFCRTTTCRGTADEPCEVDDDGCPATGAKLFWPTACVSYATNRLGTSRYDPEDTRAVIRKAFQSWSDVQCPDGTVASMTFMERDPVSCHKAQYNTKKPNVNVILFQDSMWKYKGLDATLAKTSVTYSDDTGEIYDADIEVNSAFNELTITDDNVDTDLQAVITHEAGHFIGLAHSPELDAVMYAQYPPHSTSQRYLSPDDVAAICAVYPQDKGFTCNTEPRNGFSASCDDDAKTTGLCSAQPTSANASYSAVGLVGCAAVAGWRARRKWRAVKGGVS